jgi:hypothetical protein
MALPFVRSAQWIVGAVMACASLLAQAHQDRVITWQPEGQLVGLPAAYSPSSLQASFRPVGDYVRLIGLRLRIGKNTVQLPSCVLGHVLSQRREQLSLSASWDHDEAVVPHYLALRAADADGHYQLLFNLHTARLLSMSFHLDSSNRDFPIDLHERCAADELAGIVSN